MHLLMICTAIIIACYLRNCWQQSQRNWHLRWQKTLFSFLFPPLLIFMTAIALACMGPQGQMGGLQTSWFSYVLALSYLIFCGILAIKQLWQGWQSLKSTRNCPAVNLAGRQVRLLDTKALFAASIGFWQPELVISQGLVQTLSPQQLETVLVHEEGHYHYRDTFWFFWLGWIRSCSFWLPNTENIWQELLALRELRADAYAALQVDPLLLAESILLVASTPAAVTPLLCCATLSSSSLDRLQQRIEALLEPPAAALEFNLFNLRFCHRFLLALLPLVTVMFHS
jgi:Zn-dependent protease with chaperone function